MRSGTDLRFELTTLHAALGFILDNLAGFSYTEIEQLVRRTEPALNNLKGRY
jgi:hypothetical protein